MKLHLFDMESESRLQKTTDTVCGVSMIVGGFLIVHLLFAYHREILVFTEQLLKIH